MSSSLHSSLSSYHLHQLPSSSRAAASVAQLLPSPIVAGGVYEGGRFTCVSICGRVKLGEDNYTDCGACPWGSAAVGGLCKECVESISGYDWLYLLFIALLPLLINMSYVRKHTRRATGRWSEAAEHVCCVVECAVAAVCTVLVYPPYGTLQLNGCARESLRQWYPWLYNPVMMFGRTLPCTYEYVFPLYSIPFIYFLFYLVMTVVLRSILYITLLRHSRDARAFYAALFTLPILALINSLLAGVLFYSFPVLLILYSVVGHALHLSMLRPTTRMSLLKHFANSLKDTLYMLLNCALLAFAILSIGVRFYSLLSSLVFLLFVPVPPLFFYITIPLSHPLAIHRSLS